MWLKLIDPWEHVFFSHNVPDITLDCASFKISVDMSEPSMFENPNLLSSTPTNPEPRKREN